MSEILRHKEEKFNEGTLRAYRSKIIELDFGLESKEPIVKLENGLSGNGVCLGCSDTPCMKKQKNENKLPPTFENFPGDPSTEVCPTQALSWDEKTGAIQVSENDCIGCGLCIVRCPYGALHLSNEQKAKVALEDVSGLLARAEPNDNIKHPHPNSIRKGRVASSLANALKNLNVAVQGLNDTQARILIRNIMHEIGVQCRIRRRGDSNIRMDAIAAFAGVHIGVVEIELTLAAIESPRALLEDIAILHRRFAMPLASITPISIVLSLPNARSDYYKVIDDIHKIVDIRCHTITVGSLILILWNFGLFTELTDKIFVTNIDGANFADSLASVLGKEFKFDGEPYPGATRTAK